VLGREEHVTVDDLPEALRHPSAGARGPLSIEIGTPLDEVERRLIRETLRHARGDKSLAAQLLGISTRTVYRKLAEMGEPG
jgi:two-component system response regulator HydG